MNGHDTVVRMLLERHNVDVNSKGGIALQTPLLHACMGGHSEVVRLLLKNGAEMHSRGKYGRAALITVSMKGYRECAQMLLDKGAGVDSRLGGVTALELAARELNTSMARILRKNGADGQNGSGIHFQDSFGPTPLPYALNCRDFGNEDIVSFYWKMVPTSTLEIKKTERRWV
ncbi:ankyrin repeat-containing domain protein [Pyronema domesticum]|uniref:Similar to Protein fem-1 homolog C acc. no. Q2T9K6 n=1 Tax=Pyronema omphalodes (strain CBS 100304) TaxID=1076935 RepID=U4L0G6_PYROM|nr:ankyrin repeat-containing domain protein [Pyronema domesticum]CCX08583.1 Similar to Protein fem-1 homolog C; acc. no. Q2T9K6 [Pyronema omphalodes CBS 100304]